MSRLDYLNTMTIYGLTLAGFGLLVGLLTRFSAFYCAGFLVLIYLSFPPWHGVPENPTVIAEHYLVVNRNLIELLACMAFVFLPTGQWIGLDALLFGRGIRRRELRRLERQQAREDGQPAADASDRATVVVPTSSASPSTNPRSPRR